MKLSTLAVSLIPVLLDVICAPARGLSVRSNLDFGEERNKPSIIERVYAREEKNDKADNAAKIGVICTSGGCNATAHRPDAGKASDSVSADVVVAVQVNANDGKVKDKSSPKIIGNAQENKESADGDDEDVPDVPVVIGYGGGSAATPQGHVIRPDHGVHDFYHHHPQDHVKNGGDSGFLPSLGWRVEFKTRGHYPTDYTKYNVYAANGNRGSGGGGGYGHGYVQRPTWYYNPTPWHRRNDGSRPMGTQPPPPQATTCVCHPNSVWSGTTPPTYVNFNHPGKQINDKLAPLH